MLSKTLRLQKTFVIKESNRCHYFNVQFSDVVIIMFLTVIQKEKTHGINFSFFSRYRELGTFSLNNPSLHIKNKRNSSVQGSQIQTKENVERVTNVWEHNVGVQSESTLCAWCPSLMPGVVPRTTVLQKFSLECWEWILSFESIQASVACLDMVNSYQSK